MEWQQTYGGTGNEEGSAVQETSDNGFIFAGSTDSYGAGCSNVYLVKTDSEGNEIWFTTFSSTIDESVLL